MTETGRPASVTRTVSDAVRPARTVTGRAVTVAAGSVRKRQIAAELPSGVGHNPAALMICLSANGFHPTPGLAPCLSAAHDPQAVDRCLTTNIK